MGREVCALRDEVNPVEDCPFGILHERLKIQTGAFAACVYARRLQLDGHLAQAEKGLDVFPVVCAGDIRDDLIEFALADIFPGRVPEVAHARRLLAALVLRSKGCARSKQDHEVRGIQR